ERVRVHPLAILDECAAHPLRDRVAAAEARDAEEEREAEERQELRSSFRLLHGASRASLYSIGLRLDDLHRRDRRDRATDVLDQHGSRTRLHEKRIALAEMGALLRRATARRREHDDRNTDQHARGAPTRDEIETVAVGKIAIENDDRRPALRGFVLCDR